jgi:hypothetical protein
LQLRLKLSLSSVRVDLADEPRETMLTVLVKPALRSAEGDPQGDRILNFQQSQQGAALVDDSRADNEITLKSPIYVVTGD